MQADMQALGPSFNILVATQHKHDSFVGGHTCVKSFRVSGCLADSMDKYFFVLPWSLLAEAWRVCLLWPFTHYV